MYGDGSQTRDFIYVKDIVGALTFVAEHPEVTGVFNAGYGGQITIEDLAQNIIRLPGLPQGASCPGTSGDVKHSAPVRTSSGNAGWQAGILTAGRPGRRRLEYFQGAFWAGNLL